MSSRSNEPSSPGDDANNGEYDYSDMYNIGKGKQPPKPPSSHVQVDSQSVPKRSLVARMLNFNDYQSYEEEAQDWSISV